MSHMEPREYSDVQYRQIGMLGNWNILLDAHNAMRYGFLQCRLPKPGKPIDIMEAEAHIARIENEWEVESLRRDPTRQWTGAPPFTKMPLDAKLYLHSVLNGDRVNNWKVIEEMRGSRANDLTCNLD